MSRKRQSKPIESPWQPLPAPVGIYIFVADANGQIWVDRLMRVSWQTQWENSQQRSAIGEHPTPSSIVWWMEIPPLPD